MSQHNPQISKGIDSLTVWLYFLITTIGLLCIFSVEYRSGNVIQSFLGFKREYSKQLYFWIASIVVAVIILLTDSKFFCRYC